VRTRKQVDVPSPPKRVVDIQHDVGNEQVVIAAACADDKVRARVSKKITIEHFFAQEHRNIWRSILELERRKLEFDVATIQQLFAGDVDIELLNSIIDARPEVPANIDHHIDALLWDKARLQSAQGPLAKLVEAIQSPLESPDTVKSIARQVCSSLEGFASRKYLRDPTELVSEQVKQIAGRGEGVRSHDYGIPGLDYIELDSLGVRRRRMTPGAAPGQITVVTGLSGAGKSTFTANLILGLARQGKRLAIGAWEMGGGALLELLACLDTNTPRELVSQGTVTKEELIKLEESMHRLSLVCRFIENPFRRTAGERTTNERNLDLVHGYVADAAADVFVGDLWERCLVSDDPSDEKQALFRQQAMCVEMNIHALLLAQQRLKDIENRPDKRPTREGIKGSGAWTEVADTVLGVHRPALWKRVDDNILEVLVLKQRYGKWPLAIEFGWSAETGAVTGGRSIPYEPISLMDSAVNMDLPREVVRTSKRSASKGWRG
jgi:replicative DNA helicase